MHPASVSVSFGRRLVAGALLLAMPLQLALAQSGEFLTYDAAMGTVSQSDTNAGSSNEVNVLQQSGSGAQQNLQVTGSAATVVDVAQNLTGSTVIDIHQECDPSDVWCVQNAAPVSATIAIQNVTASSSNLLNAAQLGGSGSVQTADLAADANTQVSASQTVTPETIINIFQDCTIVTGVCVQRALPEVLTLASQMIAATALNEINLLQQSSSGAVQDALVNAEANVAVTAEQFVSPRNFLSLAQTCAIDVGLCIQRAIPLITTAAQQVVNAATGNDVNLAQAGAADQNAVVNADANTDVNTQHTVTSQNTILTKQECAVKKGLCLQLDANGLPAYVFSDGETVSSGAYIGTLDDSALNDGVNRQTVTKVAKGICEDGNSCSKLQQLLLWLFGPEAQPEASQQASGGGNGGNRDTQGVSAGHRGHQTTKLGATIAFLTRSFGEERESAPAAFGGSDDAAVSEEEKGIVCSLQKAIPSDSESGVTAWAAQQLADRTGMNPDLALSLLSDKTLCAPVAREASVNERLASLGSLVFFPVDDAGPLSGNALWNKCIRGSSVTLDDIRSNPDTDELGRPKSCGAYHTQDSWYHPDLAIYFSWNRETGALELPEGYVAIVQTATL